MITKLVRFAYPLPKILTIAWDQMYKKEIAKIFKQKEAKNASFCSEPNFKVIKVIKIASQNSFSKKAALL